VTVLSALGGSLAIVAAPLIVLLGTRHTARASRDAAAEGHGIEAQASALDAWQALVQPMRDELIRHAVRISALERRLTDEQAVSDWLRTRVRQLTEFLRQNGLDAPAPHTPEPVPTEETS